MNRLGTVSNAALLHGLVGAHSVPDESFVTLGRVHVALQRAKHESMR